MKKLEKNFIRQVAEVEKETDEKGNENYRVKIKTRKRGIRTALIIALVVNVLLILSLAFLVFIVYF